MSTYRLRLNLPPELNMASGRVLEGTAIVVTRVNGYYGELSDEELAIATADPYVVVERVSGVGTKHTRADETDKTVPPPAPRVMKVKHTRADETDKTN